ncbi:hypothetical protein KSP39_PZI015457 [Platanthera zijinensis]|uniref:DUF7880 domain-containing protein n=1 Tax=Platanthera zijinensis TaxID=2320716 RepID=A0AAP0G1J2_9ASPA
MASAPLGPHAVAHAGILRRRSSPNTSPSPHCRLPPVGRRPVSLSLLLLHCVSYSPNRAIAGSPFDKYVKRKKLEPLEVYVPAVLLTEAQFKDLEDYLDVEEPKYDIGRSLLRSGPAASLRINMRAVAQYADDDGKGKTASDAVDRCLKH